MKLFIALIISMATAANCVTLDQSSIKVGWTAYKTARKVGVSGELKKFNFDSKNGKSSLEVIKSTKFTINTMKSVDTKNSARDLKIEKFFFDNLAISGQVKSATDKIIEVSMKIGSKLQVVPFTYTLKNNQLEAVAVIDLFDFLLGDNLKMINKMCLALHEGKTWNDVALKLSATLKACK